MGFPRQQQQVPGMQSAMNPVPDCGEHSYRGSGRLTGKRAVITGGDSGIGRAVAIAYAREGADVLIAYLNEDEDAAEVARLVEDAGRKCVLVRGDLAEPAHCRAVIDRAAAEFGGIDVLVSNAAFQMTHSDLGEISDEEWDYTFRLNVGAYFYLIKAALPHMGPGSSVIGSSSVNSDMPSPTLAPYAATKATGLLCWAKPAGTVTNSQLLPAANEVSWDAVWWWSRPDGALQLQPASRHAAKAQAMFGVRSPLSSTQTIIIDPQVPRTDEVLSTPRTRLVGSRCSRVPPSGARGQRA